MSLFGTIRDAITGYTANVISTNGLFGLVSIAPGHVSTENSYSTTSSDPLLADAVFTGEWEDITNFGVIVISITTDVASATNGLMMQFSEDESIHGLLSDDQYTINAGAKKTFSFQAGAKFFRIMYTNGNLDQTHFHMQTVLKPYYVKPSSHRIQDSIIDDDDAELIKAVITGKDPNNVFRNVNTTVDGDLSISSNSSGLAIAKGNVTGVSFIHKFGNAPDFDTTDAVVDIWDGADDATDWEAMKYTYSTTADIDSLSSENNSDTQDIEVQGLDTDYNLIIQTITLTGQTPVSLNTNLIRIFRLKNVGNTDNIGHIFCFVSGGTVTLGIPQTATDIRAIIQTGNNQTLMALFTIPAGKTGYMRSFFAGTSGAKKTTNYTIDLFARPFGQVFQLKHKSALVDNGTSYFNHIYSEPEILTEKTDIIIRSSATAVGVSQASISAGFDIVLEDN